MSRVAKRTRKEVDLTPEAKYLTILKYKPRHPRTTHMTCIPFSKSLQPPHFIQTSTRTSTKILVQIIQIRHLNSQFIFFSSLAQDKCLTFTYLLVKHANYGFQGSQPISKLPNVLPNYQKYQTLLYFFNQFFGFCTHSRQVWC